MQNLGLVSVTNSDPNSWQPIPVNTKLLISLAKKLGLELPVNMDLKSKNFLRIAKEKM
jgi:hypothetical protein